MDDIPEYDERLLVCQECDGDFIYTVDEQKRDEKENKEPPRKCHRCLSGGNRPQPAQQQQNRSGPRNRGRDDGGRGRGRGRGRDPFREEYRSPSFRNQQQESIYRSPAFSGSDPGRSRDRSGSGGGGRPRDRSQGGRQRFQITCSKCGRQDTIPFRPSPNRPVFCHECYEAQRLEDRKGR